MARPTQASPRSQVAAAGPAPDDHDNPWKEAIVGAFPEFMAFYCPSAHAAVDWTRGHAFLDKELRQVVRDAASGKKFVDVLVRVLDATSLEAVFAGRRGWPSWPEGLSIRDDLR